ncbi:MAG: ATP-binding protein, partial [Thermodesulfobacteriota bacterium]
AKTQDAAQASSTLKVKSEDLESLIAQVSGLRGLGAKDMEVLQSATLQLRMVPVGELFGRFKKAVRDLSEELGKPIRLEVSGEGVKIDKAIADKLSEPLMHMVRNAASHGIESPRERSAAQKGDGVIKLNAYQEGGRIIIEVSDDGRGISVDKVGKKAVKTGLLREEDLVKLTDRKILDFIFAPGFSTHDGVDKVSGRGVGMDVVKSVVTSLQGVISIETQPGKGVCFRLELPLTLAIIRAMVLESGGAKIAVPASAVDRILNMTESEIAQGSFLDKNRISLYLPDEGEVIPIVDFPGIFGLKAKGDKRCVVLLKVGGGHKVALSVDAAVGRHPLTVKPLDGFSETGYFSSASFLDEELVLILNIPSLMAA